MEKIICPRCGKEIIGLACVLPGLQKDRGMHAECCAAEISENPEIAGRHISKELIADLPALTRMLQEVVELAHEGKPLHDA